MCCKTQSPFNDVCTQDGLCARQSDASLGQVQGLLRSACTDPSWTSQSCLKLCTTGIDYLGNIANATEQYVKECQDGSWCCEAENPPLNSNGGLNSTLQGQVDTCCAQGKGVFIKNGIATNVNPNATTTGSSATSTSTPAQHSTPVAAIAGGVTGGVIGLAVIALAIFFCLRSIRRNKARKHDSTFNPSPGNIPKREVHEKYGNERVEADGAQLAPLFETDGTQVADSGGQRDGPYEI
ncbi:hypothetical protein N7G274_005111 [Stereocaulon virgatum]|uniref:Uncharacterized protein n=1 Tax=Stereocaulon virgatum TaxID=373712 RepID=A0ABR4A8A7_9LECA